MELLLSNDILRQIYRLLRHVFTLEPQYIFNNIPFIRTELGDKTGLPERVVRTYETWIVFVNMDLSILSKVS